MSDSKKVSRTMTEKGFLHKAKGKVSADAFIKAHREWLSSGTLAPLTMPVLASLDAKVILPTPALETISKIVLDHMLAKEVAKAEDAILNPKTREAGIPKAWRATVYNAKGEIQTRVNDKGEIVELQEGFDLSQRANEWADRRLFECASDCYAIVNHTSMVTKDGNLFASTITRDAAMSRLFAHKKGPVMKPQSKSTPRLGFGVKAHNDRSVFSKG